MGKIYFISELWYQNVLPECGSPQVRIRKRKMKEKNLLLSSEKKELSLVTKCGTITLNKV